MAVLPKPRKRRVTNDRLDAMVEALDQLAEYEEWRNDILPSLKKDIQGGLSAIQIREKYSSLLTARMVSIGLTEKKSMAALVAIKDVLDRTEGKAKETKEISHKLQTLPEQELDALLLTKMRDLGGGDGSEDLAPAVDPSAVYELPPKQ